MNGWISTVRRRICFGACLGLLLTVQTGRAQSDLEEAGIEYPLQIIHLTGIERLQAKADALFFAADRPEMSDVMQSWMDGSLRGLKGIDRTRPLGLMMYIKPGLTPGIAAVSYMPVSDLNEFLQYLAGETGVVKEVPGQKDRYEISDVDWAPDFAIKRVGDYVFLASLDEAVDLDRKFPNPERLVAKLNNRYDIAYSLLLKNVPPATKKLFFEFFKNQALAGLQQRDGEPEAAYRVRRANGEALVDLIDMVVSQGEELTLGGFANAEENTAYGELEISGTKDSKLSRFFQDLAGRRSYFDPVLNDSATFTLSTSVQLDEKRREPFAVIFSSAVELVSEGLKNTPHAGSVQPKTAAFFETLRNTAADGHMDLFVQLAGEAAGEYRLLGGLRVLSVGDFSQQLEDLLTFGRDVAKEGGRDGAAGIVSNVELRAQFVEGHAIHRLPLPTPPDDFGRAMFGETPNLYLCATPQALWFAVGGKAAEDQLTAALKLVSAGPSGEAPKRVSAPFLITTHASHWMNIGLTAGADPTESPEIGAVVESFQPDNDELRMTGRPTDNGVRIRTELQSGYFSWIGRAAAKQIDSGINAEERRSERRRQRVPAAAPQIP